MIGISFHFMYECFACICIGIMCMHYLKGRKTVLESLEMELYKLWAIMLVLDTDLGLLEEH